MRTLSAAETTALAARTVALRNLVWLTAKDRTTAAKQSLGFWDDVGTITHQVIDPFTGATVSRTFTGAGSLLTLEDIALSADLSVKGLRVELSGINSQVAQAVRGYDTRLAPIQIFRVILNPASGAAYAPARARFVGIVDSLEIVDPRPGGQGRIVLQAASQFRELARANPDMTSGASQVLRLATDKFYQYTNDVPKWQVMWGAHSVGVKKKDKKDRGKGDKGGGRDT